VSSRNTGRHRAPSPLSSASNLSLAISRSGIPASKASAVIVISGAMVASLALPASAATPAAQVNAATPVALSVAVVAAPSAAQAPLVPRTFGKVGFTGVVKAKAKPKAVVAPVVQRAAVAVSRSTTRSAISPTTTPAQATAESAPVEAVNTGGVLSIAASLAGIYYVYGGTTTSGFDCSGFTQYVFAKAGISIPRTAEEQRQAVRSVSDPRPGDLVFFGSPAYHVGIYAGNGMMWDSPHSGSAVALRSIWSSTASYGRP
jgi:cell wall-associated NlpC family hydrolase